MIRNETYFEHTVRREKTLLFSFAQLSGRLKYFLFNFIFIFLFKRHKDLQTSSLYHCYYLMLFILLAQRSQLINKIKYCKIENNYDMSI